VAGLQWLQVFLWFHPLVWRMRWVHDNACDEICDTFAADYMGNTQNYSKMLAQLALDMVSRPPVYGGLTMATKSDVRKRLEFLKTSISTFPLTKKSVGAFISVALLSLFSIAGLQPLMQSDKAMAGEQTTPKRSQSVIVRQLSKDYFPEISGLPTRDGKYVPAFVWGGFNVVLREIETGNDVDLTPKTTMSEWKGIATCLAISPDGKTLAYDWQIDGKNKALRLVNTDGTNNRLLLKLEDGTVAWNIQWTNDGQFVFCSFIGWSKPESETDTQFVLISAKDGSIKTLKAVSFRSSGYLSPDGNYLAYDSYSSGSKNNAIVVMSLEDQKEYPVVSDAADNDILGWSPDGKWILRLGTKDFYIAPFRQKSKPESPIFIKTNASLVSSRGITPEGQLYYQEYMPNNNVYTASINWETKTVEEDPDPISKSVLAAVKWRPEWSTDGKHITFRVDDRQNDTQSLYLYSLQDKQTRKITPDVNRIRRWRLSNDNKEIVFTEQTADVRNPVVHRINLTTGGNEIVLKEEEDVGIPQYSSDLKKAYAFTWKDAQFKLFEIDLETKKKRMIFEDTKENHSLRLSPDGKWLVCYRQSDKGEGGSLRLISIETGEHQDVYQIKAGNQRKLYPHLMSDGKHIVYLKGEYKDDGVINVLWRVNIDTKQKDRLWTTKDWVRDMRLSPSGDKLSYSKIESVTTNWVMENIFPAE